MRLRASFSRLRTASLLVLLTFFVSGFLASAELRSAERLSVKLIQPAMAQEEAEYSRDLSLGSEGVTAKNYIIVGKNTRIYAKVVNHSDQDLFGTVKFYDETNGEFVGEDQPVSIVAGSTDDVFVDWTSQTMGDHQISVRVIPWEEEGDNPDNNKVTTVIYADIDSDGDGIPNRQDPDDDNDGVPDSEDAFPLNPSESEDTDEDGIGNIEDTDDDNDGVPDTEDFFPLNKNETIDSDQDGVGDNEDAFPNDPTETTDKDGDGLGENTDPDDTNSGPVPVIETDNKMVDSNSIVTFNALKADDSDGEIVEYLWDLGDGTTAESVVVDHVYKKAGDYTVTLTVTDDKGEARSGTIEITVVHKWYAILLIVLSVFLFLVLLWYLLTARKQSRREKEIDEGFQEIEKKLLADEPEEQKKPKKSLPKKKN